VADDALQLPAHWRGEPQVWLVDAVHAGSVPGRVFRVGHERVMALQPASGAAHHLDLATALHWLRLATPSLRQVRFRLWGCEPQRIVPGAGLAPAVAAAAAQVAEEVVEEAAAWAAGAAWPRSAESAVPAR
jgi:hydrogenase maturation protease